MGQKESVEQASRHIVENVEAISALYDQAERDVDPRQRVIEIVTAQLGRPRFLFGALVVVCGWTMVNALAPWFGARALDPPPYAWLQGLSSLSALVLTILVLITQNRQGKLSEHRAHLDLQINLLAERKIAKLIALLEELRRDLPTVRNRYDSEAEAMERPADPQVVAHAIEGNLEAQDLDPDK